MLNGWDFFRIHKALDFHFHNEQYDVIKYNGKINVTPEKFGIRNDRYRYEYFGSKFFNRDKAAKFCIANFVRGNRNFVYQSYDDAEEEFTQWRKIQDSLTKVFTDDLTKIVEKININIYEITPKGNQPPLMQMIKSSFITLETAAILNQYHQEYLTKWKPICYNDPYMNDLILRIRKYTPFIKVNKEKIVSVISEKLS